MVVPANSWNHFSRRIAQVLIRKFADFFWTQGANSALQQRKMSPRPAPADAAERKAAPPVICYTVDKLPPYDTALYNKAREGMTKLSEVTVPPRDARCWEVPKGHFFRINSVEGPQVGDLNIWNANDMTERFFSGNSEE